MFRSLLDVLYPRTCLSCAELLSAAESDLCAGCARAIERAVPERSGGGPVGDVVALYVFEEESPVRALLHAVKYGAIPSLGTRLGRALGVLVSERGIRAGLVVPVPLSRRKMRERGFNQAARVAHGVSEVTGIPLADGILRRVRHTSSQTALTAQERRANVRGAFALARGARELDGMSCLLIDDVVTTGATVLECASVLRSAGASEVIVCAVAVARRTPAER